MTGNGKGDVEVIYDGQELKFPGWVEKRPIDQAADQASWLKKWLSSAVGEAVDVRAVVTLPGWFVKRTSPQGILVINPKNLRAFLTKIGNKTLSDTMIQRIAHQLEQRCRDVEPKAYPTEAKSV